MGSNNFETTTGIRPQFMEVWNRPKIRTLVRMLVPNPGTLIILGLFMWVTVAGALPVRAPLNEITTFPTMINFQGRLTDPAGQPIDGPANMIFTLYEQASSGPPLWSEEWTEVNAVPVSNGLFNVLLGSQSGGIPFNVLNRDTLYLGITVPPDPEMTPRERLTSVPYALVANSVADGAITTSKLADRAVTSAKLNLATGDVYLGQGGGSASKLRWESTNPAIHWLGYDPTIAPWWMIFSTHRNEGFIFRNDADGTVVQIGGSNSSIGQGMSVYGNLSLSGVIQSSNNIPTAALQDGVVNSRKLKLNTLSARHDQPSNAGYGGGEFFGAGNVCVEVASDVLLLATLNFYTEGGGGLLSFYVTRDGTRISSTFRQEINTSKEVVTIAMLDSNVGPGCHSYGVSAEAGVLGQASEKNFVAIPFAR